MDLEYFYQIMQLFGVLLGLIGIYFVFTIQSLDTSINSYRNNLIKSIALYHAIIDKVQCQENKAKVIDDANCIKDELCKLNLPERIYYHSFLVDGSTDDDLEKWVKIIIDEKKLDGKMPKDKLPYEYLSETLHIWKNLKEDKKKRIQSMKYPIISMVVVILVALSIITNNSFEPVPSFMSIVILFFIVFVFLNLIFISYYILINLPHE